MRKEEALEVAMLAKAVGSHLVGVDQLTVERSGSGGSANKINMQNFLAPILGGKTTHQQYETGASPEIVKAYQGLNELALQSIPDVAGGMPPPSYPNTNQPEPNININTPVINHVPIQQTNVETKDVVSSVLTRSDVDSIRNSLKGIDKSLAGLLNYLKNSKKAS